jgi:hypothetical protein
MQNKNTPEAKGFRTFVQAAVATTGAFFYGLWNLPGVSAYVTNFLQTEGLSLLFVLIGVIGVPAGLIAYFQNKKGK